MLTQSIFCGYTSGRRMNLFFEELFGFIVRCCVEIFGYYTAKVVLPVVSLGRVHVAPAANLLLISSPAYERRPNGTISVHPNIAGMIGLLVWALALALVLTVFYP
jgi:hypothetical protein